MKRQEVEEKLWDKGVHPDSLSCKKGVWKLRRGFFYTNGNTSSLVAKKVESAGFVVCNHGEVWKPFKGGASVANQSHWWVEFIEPDSVEVPDCSPAGERI